MRNTILFILVLLFSACTQTQPIEQEKFYFNLTSFFNKQAESLNSLNPDVHKIITKNGEREEKIVSDLDWQQELMVFTRADINKPSWKGLYTIDSTETETGQLINYAATDESLTTRSIELHTNAKNEITRIEIKTQPDKKIYFANTHMVYIPKKSYAISTEQNLVLFEKDNFTVNATIIQ